MNKYQIYYQSFWSGESGPKYIDADSYYVHTSRDSGYMSDSVSFYRDIDGKKTLTATVQRVNHVVLIGKVGKTEETLTPTLIPSSPSTSNIEEKRNRWWKFF